MELLAQLWLPIILSAAAVWVASAIIWMALPHHRKDFGRLPDEAGFMAALRSLGVGPGNYGFPYGEHGQHKDPEFQKKWTEGPTGFMTVLGKVSMGRNMLLSFLVYLVISFFAAYLGAITIPRGTGFWDVMQVMGTAGVLGYAFGGLPHGIWFGQSPRAMTMCVIDGFVYGLITGAVFAALWPAA